MIKALRSEYEHSYTVAEKTLNVLPLQTLPVVYINSSKTYSVASPLSQKPPSFHVTHVLYNRHLAVTLEVTDNSN